MTTIQLRIDDATKNKANKVLKGLGMDMSSAVKIYLHQIILKKGIPMPLLTENGLTPEQEAEILKASREARAGKNITKPMEAKEAIEYLRKMR